MNDNEKQALLKRIGEICEVKYSELNETLLSNILVEFEERRKIRLTDDYRLFLINFSTCMLKDDYYYRPIEKNSWTPADGYETVDFFYGFSNDNFDVRVTNDMLSSRLSSKYIVIAELSGGNHLCICMSEEDYGKIYFWDHEASEVDENEYYLTANSFSELMNNFTVYNRKGLGDLIKVKITFHNDLL